MGLVSPGNSKAAVSQCATPTRSVRLFSFSVLILGVKCPESCNFQGAQDKGSQNMEREKQTWQNVSW